MIPTDPAATLSQEAAAKAAEDEARRGSADVTGISDVIDVVTDAATSGFVETVGSAVVAVAETTGTVVSGVFEITGAILGGIADL